MSDVEDLDAFLRSNGYLAGARLPDGRVAAIQLLTFGRARINVGSFREVLDGY